MSPRNALPFPRGGTLGDGQLTLDDTSFKRLEGRIVEALDDIHGTGRTIKLRIVKNDSGGALTVARKFMGFTKNSDYDFGGRCTDVSAAGEVCKPLDDAYTVGQVIPQYDLFYVIEEGPCSVLTETTAVNLAAGGAVATDATGFINGATCAQATEFCVGTVNAATTSAATATVVEVQAGLKQIGT